MKFFRYLVIIVIIIVGAFILFLAYATIADYRPDETTPITGGSDVYIPLPDSIELDIIDWNLGYCGLDKDMDFFWDGGKGVRPEKEQVSMNLEAVLDYITGQDTVDCWLFQEVDRDSKRSYHNDQFAAIDSILGDYYASFGTNYNVFFVPLPVSKPYGRVLSGIASYCRFPFTGSVRYSFPGNYSWPLGLFMLDRCFMAGKIAVCGGKDLLIVNTHNSAYDDGSLRQQQMEYLKEFLLEEYRKGNYVLAGGDWNQCPAGFTPGYTEHLFDTVNLMYIEDEYLPGDWTWAFDPAAPTNRRVLRPYDPGTSPTTVIDYYLLSPNIELVSVKTDHLGFEHSDHNPVRLKVKLKTANP